MVDTTPGRRRMARSGLRSSARTWPRRECGGLWWVCDPWCRLHRPCGRTEEAAAGALGRRNSVIGVVELVPRAMNALNSLGLLPLQKSPIVAQAGVPTGHLASSVSASPAKAPSTRLRVRGWSWWTLASTMPSWKPTFRLPRPSASCGFSLKSTSTLRQPSSKPSLVQRRRSGPRARLSRVTMVCRS